MSESSEELEEDDWDRGLAEPGVKSGMGVRAGLVGSGMGMFGSAGELGQLVSSKEESDNTDVVFPFVCMLALASMLLLGLVVITGAGASALACAFFLILGAGSMLKTRREERVMSCCSQKKSGSH